MPLGTKSQFPLFRIPSADYLFRHIEGDDEAMQVEECGNMLLMTYAMYKFMDNATEGELYLRKHFSILQQWSQFLEIHALVPGSQLR